MLNNSSCKLFLPTTTKSSSSRPAPEKKSLAQKPKSTKNLHALDRSFLRPATISHRQHPRTNLGWKDETNSKIGKQVLKFHGFGSVRPVGAIFPADGLVLLLASLININKKLLYGCLFPSFSWWWTTPTVDTTPSKWVVCECAGNPRWLELDNLSFCFSGEEIIKEIDRR